MHPARKHSIRLLSTLVPILVAALHGVAQRSARTVVIHGTVTDSASGRLLRGVQIMIEGTQTGTLTFDDGVYHLRVPDSLATTTLSVDVRSIRYQPQQRKLSPGAADSLRADFILAQVKVLLNDISNGDPVVRKREVCSTGDGHTVDDVPYSAFSYRLFRTLAADSPNANLFILAGQRGERAGYRPRWRARRNGKGHAARAG